MQCDVEFCWVCREPWAMHDPLNSHAVEMEGKQCNLVLTGTTSKWKSTLLSPGLEEKNDDVSLNGYSHLPDRTVQFIQYYAR